MAESSRRRLFRLLVAAFGLAASACAAPGGAVPATLPPLSTVGAPTTTSTSAPGSSSTLAAATTTTTPPIVHHKFPIQPIDIVGYHHIHAGYPATDVFAPCGSVAVAPVDGVVLEINREDHWQKSVNDPTTRGGLYVSILGDDHVRYYMAHFREIDANINVGVRVAAGMRLAEVGKTGDAGSCHVHFGLSVVCDSDDWWVRRGVIWPFPYLDDWKAGGNSSPGLQIYSWSMAHPNACQGVEGLTPVDPAP